MILSFASFELDTDRCALKRDGEDLALRPQCYDLLLLLLQRSGKVVAKQQIVERIWQGIAVTDDSLTQCVSELRHVLGSDGARIIRTVPRRGYLLDADVTMGAPASAAAAREGQRLPAPIWTGLTLAAGLRGLSPSPLRVLGGWRARRKGPIFGLAAPSAVRRI